MKPHSVPLAAPSPTPASPGRSVARRAPALLAAVLVGGCSAAATPGPARVVDKQDPPLPVAAPSSTARWVDSGGATLVGPTVSEGTLVLLGGRRGLLGKDGALHNETVPAPEPLQELIEIPGAAGEATSHIVGRSLHGLYRFDDPLGAPALLARSTADIARIGAGPGVVAVWTKGSDLPRFVGVVAGASSSLPGLPRLPLRALAFADARHGAAIEAAVGLVTTADGGASWQLVDAATPGDALQMSALRRRGAAIRAFTFADGPEATVDPVAAKLGPIEPPQAPPRGEPPLLRWIQITGRDPLEAAASGGIDLGARGALVASHGQLARIDPKTGAVLELVEFARGKWMNACSATTAGGEAFIACALSEDQGGAELFDPFGVLHVVTSDPLHAERPIVIRNGDVELRSSPSGGAMLLGSCAKESDGGVCVRQSEGKWMPLHPTVDLAERGVGPLADGRIAYLRGITAGDVMPEADVDAGPSDDDPPTRRLHVAILDAGGRERALGPITLGVGSDFHRVESPIEEDRDHTLRFVVESSSGLVAVSQPPVKEAGSTQLLAGASSARLHAGRGIAAGEGHVLVSPDGGATWSEAPAPARARSALKDPSELAVSAVGARVGSMLRLGWGSPEATSEPPPLPDAPPLDPPPRPRAPDRALTCTTGGRSTSAAPLREPTQIKELFASKPPKAGTRREASAWWLGRAGLLDTIALLEEDGPDTRGAAPERWTLHWLDSTEIGARPRSVSVQAATAREDAKAPGRGASLRFAAASGGRALFALHAAERDVLVRTRPGGGAEVAEITGDLLPENNVVFGTEKGEAIAWMHDADLIVWQSGEAPRSIAQVAARSDHWLGRPTRDAVPILLGGVGWAITRRVPIPPLEQPATAKAPRPAPPSFTGWTATPNPRIEAGSLSACAANARGASFSVAQPVQSVAIDVDGLRHAASSLLYDLRIDGASACIAGVRALIGPPLSRGSGPVGAQPTGNPVTFVRVDLASNRAEGGECGTASVPVFKLSCALAGPTAKP